MKLYKWSVVVMKAKKVDEYFTIGIFASSAPVSVTVPVRYNRGKECGYWGNNTNSILPYIDYVYLRNHPKIIIGYSDTTALLLGIYAKTGLVTFYGPALASSFGEFPPFVDMTYDNFKSVICDGIMVPYEYRMPNIWTDEFIDWSQQEFFGTEYMPEIKEGDILFIEDSLKDACTIERTFSLLKLSGVFERIGGVILGKHEKFNDNGTGRKPCEILLEILDDYKIPFLVEFDCCHTHPMFTMPIGCQAELNATAKTVKLLEYPLE